LQQCAPTRKGLARHPHRRPGCVTDPAPPRNPIRACSLCRPVSTGAQLRKLGAQAGADEQSGSGTASRHVVHVCVQCETVQPAPGRLRPAHDRCRQAAQGHPGRRCSQAPGLCSRGHPHPKAVPAFPGCPFPNLTASKTPWAVESPDAKLRSCPFAVFPGPCCFVPVLS